MSEEKKNATAKEVKEEARELSEEELAQVSGGTYLTVGGGATLTFADARLERITMTTDVGDSVK